MELLEGESLGARIERGGPMPVDEVVAIARQVCLALGAAHALLMVHRDLKPDNVMLSPVFGQKDFVRVLDFGIARAITAGDEPKLTATNAILGTPHYIAPEQVIARPLDGRADLYALGCVLYEMLTGHPPFDGSELMPTLLRHMNEAPVPLADATRALGRAVPPALARLVDQLLAKEADARPPNAAAVIDALDRCLDAAPAPAPAPPPSAPAVASTVAAPRVAKPSRVRRFVLAAAALAALVTLGGAVLFEEELGLPALLGYGDADPHESRGPAPMPAPTPTPTPDLPRVLDPSQAHSAEELAYLDLMELTAKGSWDEANQRLATAPAPTTGPYAEPLRLFRSMIASHVARDAAP
jgi:serine/threonine-protein kinase